MLDVGDKAPQFTLPDQNGNNVSLSNYAGDWVLVWWIPSTMQEMTPACCDTIAQSFAGAIADGSAINVIGLSFDTPKMMKDFAIRAQVLFPLLADEDTTVGEAYCVKRTGDWDCFPKKQAYLVTPEQTIHKVYRNIDPDFFVDEVVEDLRELNVISAEDLSPLQA